jgi:DNA polymerase
MIVGEAPGADEDEKGEPFIGPAGEILREVVRATKILNKSNTLITNVCKCRPPKNKFPKDESADICMSNWFWKEFEIAKPERMLLLGSTPLKYVANMEGITACRGQWYRIKGVRTMATFHPSYILRTDRDGTMYQRNMFESDINEVAAEVKQILEKRAVEEIPN